VLIFVELNTRQAQSSFAKLGIPVGLLVLLACYRHEQPAFMRAILWLTSNLEILCKDGGCTPFNFSWGCERIEDYWSPEKTAMTLLL